MGNAYKGSQKYLQNYVNIRTEELNESVFAHSASLMAFAEDSLSIKWESPLMEKNYIEYQDDFLKFIYSDKKQRDKADKKLRGYWPKRGPVWGGLVVVTGKNGEKGLILVEAKAYPGEASSKMKATADISIDIIKNFLLMTQKIFGSRTQSDPWINKYYQFANRLCFLHLLNEVLNIPLGSCWLILKTAVLSTLHKNSGYNTIEKFITH